MSAKSAKVIEFPKLSMQQQVDTCQAFLELDELQRDGLVEGFGSIDRSKCKSLLARAKRKGFTPSDNHFVIGREYLEFVGGKFTDQATLANESAGLRSQKTE